MAYIPRRLRKPKGPKWALVTPDRITREQAERIKDQWRTAQKQDTVVLAGGFDVRKLR